MASENIKVTTNQKDWDDFFASEFDIKDAFTPVDLYAARVRVACELGDWKVKKTDQRLDETTPEKIRVTVEFEFDR